MRVGEYLADDVAFITQEHMAWPRQGQRHVGLGLVYWLTAGPHFLPCLLSRTAHPSHGTRYGNPAPSPLLKEFCRLLDALADRRFGFQRFVKLGPFIKNLHSLRK